MFVELLARYARLDHAVEILGMDGEDLVHVLEVDRDAAERRVDVALERGASAEGDDRHAMAGANADDLLHFLRRARIDNRVGGLVAQPRGRITMLLARRERGGEPLAEDRSERGDGCCDRIGIAPPAGLDRGGS